MRHLFPVCILCLMAGLATTGEATWHWANPMDRTYVKEPLRVPLTVPEGDFHVVLNGKDAPHEVIDTGAGTELWITVDAGPREDLSVEIMPGGPAASASPAVKISGDDACYEIFNGSLAIRIPKDHTGEIRPPILGVQVDGKWVGVGGWETALAFSKCTARVLATGRAFARIQLRYEFAAKVGVTGDEDAFAEVDITLVPGRPYAIVEERHTMTRNDAWTFDLAASWGARHGTIRIHSGGADGSMGALKKKTDWTLATGQTRWPDKLVDLMPRWTQHYDDGWYFAVDDGKASLGALVGRTSRWLWPHNNEIEVRVRQSADAAILRCPTLRGSRWWLLTALPPEAAETPEALVSQAVITPLDKVVHEFITAWPGRQEGDKAKFASEKPYGDHLNPTGFWRQQGREAVKNMGAGAAKAGISDLTFIESLLHPDTYGSYWDFMSPENPNFYSDFIKRPAAMAANLKEHPRFDVIKAWVEQRLHEDVYHSVTLPGGAGQECPGYQVHGMQAWAVLAPLCKQHFGFDMTTWPRYRAGAEFLLKTSQPIGGGKRRIHPAGDTHPPGPDIFTHAQTFGVTVDYAKLVSEEFPGFGAVFRDRSGTDQETFVAFKAGPNRGHFHGDQLSIHLCGNARPLAIDHMCSYGPRAGQEHMHNRVSFRCATMPWANLDGYERLIAFTTSPQADVAIAEVSSPRLRAMVELPPEQWDARVDVLPLKEDLRYRRTLVFVRGAAGPYLVLRDQYAAPADSGIEAVYNLHVLGGKADRTGGTVVFDGLTLVMVGGGNLNFETRDWAYNRMKKDVVTWEEKTKGVRFSSGTAAGEFISVLVPGDQVPAITAVPGGVRVGEDTITFGGGLDVAPAETCVSVKRGGADLVGLTGAAIDLDRSQGEIGLFVPDAGYPFGPIPDWLIRQRRLRPAWYRSWRAIVAGGE